MAGKAPLESRVEALFIQAERNQKALEDEYRTASSVNPKNPGKKGGDAEVTSKMKPKEAKGKPTGSKPRPRDGRNNYGISSEFEKKEYFDSDEVLCEKVSTLVQWIRGSKFCIVFTGAGISTSTGIPDFRSGVNTVLPTGPGKWEKRSKGISSKPVEQLQTVLKAVPSLSHMAVVRLQREGMVKMVVSQNTDGLHRRSGLSPDVLAELHGNTNLEKCLKCERKYMRDFRTRSSTSVHDHLTGRCCDDPNCKGPLADSIINFGEDLPEDELKKGFNSGRKADLCIVLGSSLRVFPAADIPGDMIKRGAKVVICNLQKTPFNKECALEIHATIDTLMSQVMQRLGLEVPSFKLIRCFAVEVTEGSASIQGLDPSTCNPYSFLKEVFIQLPSHLGSSAKLTKEPFRVEFFRKVAPTASKPLSLVLTLGFQGHYQEPDLTVKHTVCNLERTVYMLHFDVASKEWNVARQ